MDRHSRLSLTRRHVLSAVAALAFSGAALSAHDLWIEPSAFLAEPGKIVALRLLVGQDLLGDPVPRDPALIDQFIVADANGRAPVVGRDGGDPAGLLRVPSPGLLVVGYRSRPSPVALPAAKFNQYLEEEGLDAIARLRAERKQTGADARETFVRCAKSLMLSGAATETQRDRALGFTLELVAERNPYTLTGTRELPLRLTYEGQPLAGALVVAVSRKNPSAKLSARSDKDGRVRFRLADKGFWLIKSVHMVPAPAGSGADYASYWASTTFDTGIR
jgi:uncharacterized GH25 family protein